MRLQSEEVGVGAEAEADELELVVDDAVKENQVGFDVAVADAGEFALERMVAEGRLKGALCAEKPDDGLDSFGIPAAAEGALVVAVECGGKDGDEHGGHSSGMASRAANISSTLSKGPYRGSVPASRRSRSWRVSSLGISSFSCSAGMAGEGVGRVLRERVFMAGNGPCMGGTMVRGRGHCKQIEGEGERGRRADGEITLLPVGAAGSRTSESDGMGFCPVARTGGTGASPVLVKGEWTECATFGFSRHGWTDEGVRPPNGTRLEAASPNEEGR